MKKKIVFLALIVGMGAASHADQVVLDTGKDSEVYDQQPDMFMGGDPVIEIHADWADPEVLWPAKGLFWFDLSGLIGIDYIVDEAILELYVLENNIQQAPLDIFRSAESWQESAVTWNTRPGENHAIYVRDTPPVGTMTEPALWNPDVTEIVQSWFDGSPNHGFYIDVPNTGPVWVSVLLASKENPHSAILPRLHINYHTQANCNEESRKNLYLDVPSVCNGHVVIRFGLSTTTNASVRIFDASGALVETLVQGSIADGIHSIHWTGEQGVYFLYLETTNYCEITKLVVME
ncbi:DNRLRE domain-containing protein [candidate division WOR-3 bacterium]|nr:DNRLRE domain-containing protein [candidate division WOR-3 bacterium]